MAEASGSGSIQVEQSSTPIVVVSGPSLVTASAPAGGAVDVDMTDSGSDHVVCVHPDVATDPHGGPSALETDDDRNEGGGDGEAGPGTSGITVDDVTTWPAVHVLASMAHAPSSGLAVTPAVESAQETASSEPGAGEAAANSASDNPGEPPDNLHSSVSDAGANGASYNVELLYEEQGLGGAGLSALVPSSVPSSSQSTATESLSVNQSPSQASQPVQAQATPNESQLEHPELSTQSAHPALPQGSNLEPSSPPQQQNIHTLGQPTPSPQPTQVLSHGQTSQPSDSQGNDISVPPQGQVPDTTTTAQSGLADEAFDDDTAGIVMEIGIADDLQVTGTAGVQFVLTAANAQADEEPSSIATVSTGIINIVGGDEVGFGEDFEETSSEGSSPSGFEGGFDEDSDYESGEVAHGALHGHGVTHLHANQPTPAGTIHQPSPVLNILAHTPPFPLTTNLAFNNLSPANHNLGQFLIKWSGQTNISKRPSRRSIDHQVNKPITCIRSQDLYGDQHDLQGINWIAMGVTRKQARDFRLKSFHNYVSVKDSDQPAARPADKMPWKSESYFRFRKMHVKTTVHLAHFQLRNLLACTTRSCAFYSQCRGVVRKINTLTGAESVAMRFNEHSNVQISTIAADLNVLVAGGFSGEYCISDLTSEYVGTYTGSTRSEGTVTRHPSGISNHIQVHSLRNSSGPLAAFASNDLGLRVLDLKTGKVISAVQFPFAVNCTAISPDRRLRVVVGDSLNAYIIAAEPERSSTRRNSTRQPEVLKVLGGHKDYGFACAWAPDGYTLATGNQDRTIKIWDARKWNNAQGQSTPVATLYTEMAGVRSLQFSPAGSGKRVLVAAEEADFVSVIDAQSFRTCQTLDIFGEISGVSLTNTGRDLLVLCSDRTRGGLLKFERCDTENALANGGRETERNKVLEMRRPGCSELDWPGQQDEVPRRVRQRTNRLRLRAAAALDMEPF